MMNNRNHITSTITHEDKLQHKGPLYPEHLDAWELGSFWRLLHLDVDNLQTIMEERSKTFWSTSASSAEYLNAKRDLKICQLAMKIRSGDVWRTPFDD